MRKTLIPLTCLVWLLACLTLPFRSFAATGGKSSGQLEKTRSMAIKPAAKAHPRKALNAGKRKAHAAKHAPGKAVPLKVQAVVVPNLHPELEGLPQGMAVKGLGSPAQAPSRVQKEPLPLAPEFRPPVDALTPDSAIGREPKTVERQARPGISATLPVGHDTDITGVLSLPGSSASSLRPYGQPESGAKSGASGGVMLKRTF